MPVESPAEPMYTHARAAAAQGSEPAQEALERLGDRDGSPSRRGGVWRELLDGFRHR